MTKKTIRLFKKILLICSYGYLNRTYKVERITSGTGPEKLLYKKYGGSTFDVAKIAEPNPPNIQSLIAYELSSRGLGPKLYGLTDNEIVQEYIDGHTLTAEEAFSPKMIKDIAKTYAKFHAVYLPLKNNPFNLLDSFEATVAGNKSTIKEILDSKCCESEEAILCFSKLLKFPFDDEIEWIKAGMNKIKQRTVFCHMGGNYLNILVKNKEPEDENSTRTVLVDYDYCSYSPRGYDFAGHFICRMFDSSNIVDKVLDVSYPSEKERILFLNEYLAECEKLFDDFDPKSLDTLQNLIIEVDYNSYIFTLTILMFSLSWSEIILSDPRVIPMIELFFELNQNFKENLVKKYSSLAE